MNLLATIILWFALVFGLFEILEGAFYENILVEIPKKIVVDRFLDVTKKSCVHRCRHNVSCHQAAMQGSDCLFLRDGVESRNEEDEMMKVTLLKKTRKLVGKI